MSALSDSFSGGRGADLGLRTLFRALQVLVLIFCLAPPALVVSLSFFRDVFQNFPPHELTAGLYSQLVRASTWRSAIVFSFKLGLPTSALTLLLVTPAAVALERARIRGRSAFELIALIPLLMPATGYAVALYIIYLKLGWVGRFFPLMIAESIITAPVAFLILRAALQRMPHRLDFVAMSLGASRGRALLDVSVALLRPAMLVGMLFALSHVFDDALYITFLGGPGLVTVSKAIFDSIEYSLDPVVAALSSVFMVFMALLLTTATALRRGSGRGWS